VTAGPEGSAVQATVLGYPRIGRHRELKRATEGYWAGTVSAQQLAATGAAIRRQNCQSLAAAGIAEVPVNDFSFYDHVADMIQLLGAAIQRTRLGLPLLSTTTIGSFPQTPSLVLCAR
jgi:5-methyltetrahydropteroyltriglutamate--homocysteine methyltransferase